MPYSDAPKTGQTGSSKPKDLRCVMRVPAGSWYIWSVSLWDPFHIVRTQETMEGNLHKNLRRFSGGLANKPKRAPKWGLT